MTESLTRWISAADALRHIEHFQMPETPIALSFIRTRADDYYTSLVGDLFDRMRENSAESREWARLGNAFAQFVEERAGPLINTSISRQEAALYAAAAFYCGGFPASAYISMIAMRPVPEAGIIRACFDLIARPAEPLSVEVQGLLEALRTGDTDFLTQRSTAAQTAAVEALAAGPDEWVPARLYEQLLRRFAIVNLRAVLPARPDTFWQPLVSSFVSRVPSTWEFFPSQIQAIQAELLSDGPSFTLQMPTGAGKTTLCETLLFDHLQRHPTNAAVLLVPYRSLASELRKSLVRQLNAMGISSRCAYGGTVPTGDEVHNLEDTRLVVATPEALSGLLSADQTFSRRISLVICDEGHLLGAQSRGIGLELLLARLKGRDTGSPRFVFMSAIVPNVQEINAWLGGTQDTVISSEYRPAIAEFGVLREHRTSGTKNVDLEVHPHMPEPPKFTIEGFLSKSDFQYVKESTGRTNTLNFSSFKTRAVAAARKALPMGTAVIFATNKRGEQGAIGIAEELLEQLTLELTLPKPSAFGSSTTLIPAVDYLRREFGDQWVGTRSLAQGAVLHHGDIPQEAREVLEDALRRKHSQFAICTSTLAEGVNLPIRTLVLYSVRRRLSGGGVSPMLSRDIKNLVGRAGRAGATTKGLVICANADDWPAVERVALEQPGENMVGALRALVDAVQRQLVLANYTLTNEDLEGNEAFHSLVDGIDSTLIDLAAEEITAEALVQLAVGLADHTLAVQNAPAASVELVRTLFRLRASRVAAIHAAGRISWMKETGAKLRLLSTVENDLEPLFTHWETLEDPTEDDFVAVVLTWAWQHGDLTAALRQSYRLDEIVSTELVRTPFFTAVRRWLAGDTFPQIAAATARDIDDVLAIQTAAISFGLQTVVEQALALLSKLLESRGGQISESVAILPELLRFGVPNRAACMLCAGGVRHRRAAILLGETTEIQDAVPLGRIFTFAIANQILRNNATQWRARLGTLVYDNTLVDVS